MVLAKQENNKRKQLVSTHAWSIEMQHKTHVLIIEGAVGYEVITINHFAMVLNDKATNEKLFFAKHSSWEEQVKKNSQLVL